MTTMLAEVVGREASVARSEFAISRVVPSAELAALVVGTPNAIQWPALPVDIWMGAEPLRPPISGAIGLFAAVQLFVALGAWAAYRFVSFLVFGTTGSVHPYVAAALIPFGFGLAATAVQALRELIHENI
jgi:hypothetical protein